MPNVQIRDANDHEKILVPTLRLSFEPRENKPIWVRRRPHDAKSKGYLITGVLQYEVVEEAPEESGIVLLARPIAD